MGKIKHNPLVAYGYMEQPKFNGLTFGGSCCSSSSTSTSKNYDAEIKALQQKNQEQDTKDQSIDTKNQEQDAAIAALKSSTGNTVTLVDGVAPTGVTKRYTIKQGENEIGNIDIPTNNVIESASYNPATKKITFVVTGGNNLEVDVQDIIGDVVQKSVYDTKVKELTDSIKELKGFVDNLKDTLDIEGDNTRDMY